MPEIVVRVVVPEGVELEEVGKEVKEFAERRLLAKLLLRKINRELEGKKVEISEEELIRMGDELKERIAKSLK